MPKYTTNCGEKIYSCSSCKFWDTLQCDKCIIHELRLRIQTLCSENSFLKNHYDTQLDIPISHYRTIKRDLISDPTPIPYNLSYFLTITFDPSRFDQLGLSSVKEEDYILQQLHYSIKDGLIFKLYGCFELQNNGTTHAHALIQTYQPVELRQFLKKRFTNNMRNQNCIDLQPAKHSGTPPFCIGLDYINKIENDKGCENKTWFSLIESSQPPIQSVAVGVNFSLEKERVPAMRDSLDIKAPSIAQKPYYP